MAELIPKRIIDGENHPVTRSTTVLAVDDPSWLKGYKVSVSEIAGFGRLVVDVAWNLYNSWYSPDIPLTINRDSFLGMFATVFDDDGNAYDPSDVFDAAASGQEGKVTGDPYGKNWRANWGVTIRYNFNTNKIQMKHNMPALSNDWDIWDNPSGWGNRPPFSAYSSQFLTKYRATDRVRVRVVILFNPDLN